MVFDLPPGALGIRAWRRALRFHGGPTCGHLPTAYNSVYVPDTGTCTMRAKRILACWIGHADLTAMANDLSEADRQRVLTALGARPNPNAQKGPIRTLAEAEPFDRIHLLSNYQSFLADWFAKWLAPKPVMIHQVEIAAPTDYVSIFRAADTSLAAIVNPSTASSLSCASTSAPAHRP
jgi:hypothetical protein